MIFIRRQVNENEAQRALRLRALKIVVLSMTALEVSLGLIVRLLVLTPYASTLLACNVVFVTALGFILEKELAPLHEEYHALQDS